MNNPKIGIVGAGPGGLVAARILSLQGKDVTIFERESSFFDRTQGGSLDIHADAGQIALSKAGLMGELEDCSICRPGGSPVQQARQADAYRYQRCE